MAGSGAMLSMLGEYSIEMNPRKVPWLGLTPTSSSPSDKKFQQ